MPDDTVIDGEVVALDDSSRPSFNALQNLGSSQESLFYYVFDILMLAGRNVMSEPWSARRALLREHLLPKLGEPIRHSFDLDAELPVLIESVRAIGLEGLVAKRLDSKYEYGQRSGAWQKMRINRAQEFVIGGYTLGGKTFDSLIFGYYEGGRFLYAARTRSGFTLASREQLYKRFRDLENGGCPFANLPEARSGRWSEGLTAKKMKDCRWLRPVLVAAFEYVEWTPDGHLRHSRFLGLREDKNPVMCTESSSELCGPIDCSISAGFPLIAA